MRRAWLSSLLGVALGCTPAAAPRDPVVPTVARPPRLLPPAVLDLDAPDAAYRVAVAVQLQPPWGQFLEDCRLRLPATDPLNVMSLATTADLTIDTAGKVVAVSLTGSGNGDFDRAVRQVITDAAPLPKPPVQLRADDDQLHLRWLFARDRRQAGPVTSSVLQQVLPVGEVTARLIKAGDLTRAARRIEREPAGPARTDAITNVMTAGLRDGLGGSDGGVQRAALAAIGQANVGTLAIALYDFIQSTGDSELRRAALHTAAVLGDHAVVTPLLEQLRADFTDRKLAVADAQALIALDAKDQVVAAAAEQLAGRTLNPVALHVIGLVEVQGLADSKDLAAAMFKKWQRSPDARVRAGVCAAHTRSPIARATAALTVGLFDRDAKVRAACLQAVIARMAYANEQKADVFVGSKNVERVIALVRDRDVLVRAAAIEAIAAVRAESAHGDASASPRRGTVLFPDLSADPAAEVRAAYLRAIATLSQLRPLPGWRDRVAALTEDRDATVRAAAWETWRALLVDKIAADPRPAELAGWTVRAIADPEPLVRRAVIDVITDEVVLLRLSSGDDDPQVRTRALVRAVGLGGRGPSADLLLGRFVAAAPGSAERVRAALAWHLSH